MFFAFAVVGGGWLLKNSPGLAEKRVSLKVPVKGWDKAIMLLLGVFIVVLLVVAGLDAIRFGLTQMPLVPRIIGFVGFAIGLSLNFWAMKENALRQKAHFPQFFSQGFSQGFSSQEKAFSQGLNGIIGCSLPG
jgi:protein-S-isoprenylcysteine O-methyltransferase Ste14